MSIVYLNGEFIPEESAVVSVNDRGFLFGDGVYEVTPAYRGHLFRFPKHIERIGNGLAALRIDYETSELEAIHRGLLERNDLAKADVSYVYIQVTRGTAPRSHAFPNPSVAPTVYAFAKQYKRPEEVVWSQGYEAITVPDRRWPLVNIKTIALLPNVLAQQAAADAGVADSIFVKDGIALEGAHNNLFAVIDGVVTTAPKSNYILHGVTRELVLELAEAEGIPVSERSIPIEEFRNADEAFFTGTTTEIRPTVRVDGQPIGDGRVGPITKRLFDAFLRTVDSARPQ